jgi:CRISPR-associated endoribonuclease Cas6
MQLRIRFDGKKQGLAVPLHYNKGLQAVIYQKIKQTDPLLATYVHDKGAKDPETARRLKLFTFSRLLPSGKPKLDPQKKVVWLRFPISWIIASPISDLVVALYNGFLKDGSATLFTEGSDGEQILQVSSLWVEQEPKFSSPVLVETLSPITVYRTEEKDGKKFTRYLCPSDPDFSRLVLENLCRKHRTLTGAKISPKASSYIKPVRTFERETVVYYGETLIKAWSGVFELSVPLELFRVAFSCGLGAKNSQGFGCIAVWRGNL